MLARYTQDTAKYITVLERMRKMNDEVILLMKDRSIKMISSSKLLSKSEGAEIALLQIGTDTPIYLAINANDLPCEYSPCTVIYSMSVLRSHALEPSAEVLYKFSDDYEDKLINAPEDRHVKLQCKTFVDYLRFVVSVCKINETRDFITTNRTMGLEDSIPVVAITDVDIIIDGESKEYSGKDFLTFCSKAQGWGKKCLTNIIESWYDNKSNSYMKLAIDYSNYTWRYLKPKYDKEIHKTRIMVDDDEVIGIYCYSSYGYVFMGNEEWRTLNKIGQADLKISAYLIKGDDDSYETDHPITVEDIEHHPEYFFVTDTYRYWIKNSIELVNYLATINSLMNNIRIIHDIAGGSSTGYNVTLTSTFIMYSAKSVDGFRAAYEDDREFSEYLDKWVYNIKHINTPSANHYHFDGTFCEYSITVLNDERMLDTKCDSISECCKIISKLIK